MKTIFWLSIASAFAGENLENNLASTESGGQARKLAFTIQLPTKNLDKVIAWYEDGELIEKMLSFLEKLNQKFDIPHYDKVVTEITKLKNNGTLDRFLKRYDSIIGKWLPRIVQMAKNIMKKKRVCFGSTGIPLIPKKLNLAGLRRKFPFLKQILDYITNFLPKGSVHNGHIDTDKAIHGLIDKYGKKSQLTKLFGNLGNLPWVTKLSKNVFKEIRKAGFPDDNWGPRLKELWEDATDQKIDADFLHQLNTETYKGTGCPPPAELRKEHYCWSLTNMPPDAITLGKFKRCKVNWFQEIDYKEVQFETFIEGIEDAKNLKVGLTVQVDDDVVPASNAATGGELIVSSSSNNGGSNGNEGSSGSTSGSGNTGNNGNKGSSGSTSGSGNTGNNGGVRTSNNNGTVLNKGAGTNKESSDSNKKLSAADADIVKADDVRNIMFGRAGHSMFLILLLFL